MAERNLDFDKITDRRNTNCLKYDFAVKRGMPEDVLPLWVADMDFQTSSYVQDALIKQAQHGIFGYSDGQESYFEAVKGWLKKHHDWEVQEKWLVKTPGVVMALALSVKAYTDPGDAVLIQSPVYYPFSEVISDNGRKIVSSDLFLGEDNRYHIDYADFEKKIAEEEVKLFFLCNPHNPVGRVWTKEELETIGDICYRHHVIVVSDEIHADFVFKGKHQVFAAISKEFADFTITCPSPSKTFNLAGMMISNVIIRDEGLKEIWLGRHYNFDNPLSIAAAQAAYEKGEPWLEELRAYLDENFRFTGEYLKERLPKAKYRVSEATYLAWVDLNAYFEPDEHLPLFFAYKAGVLLEGGNMFVQNSDGFIRLNLACPKATLAEGLRRICEAVNTKHTEKYLGEK
mgnify:CR=1 FL=1